nr:MAG TPA: hypothetical protein [Caudoviricetes sp.]
MQVSSNSVSCATRMWPFQTRMDITTLKDAGAYT